MSDLEDTMEADRLAEEERLRPRERTARVFSKWPADRRPQDLVAAFLPDNYEVVGWGSVPDRGTYVIIRGRDHLGWTMDDFIVPRMASGLLWCEEVKDD